MPWTQQQAHPLAANTRLICRYHRLSTRFELSAEHAPAASESSGECVSHMADCGLASAPVGV